MSRLTASSIGFWRNSQYCVAMQVTYEQPVSGISPSLAYPIPDNRDKPYVVHSIFRTMRLQCSVNVHIAPSYVWRDCAIGENVYCSALVVKI